MKGLGLDQIFEDRSGLDNSMIAYTASDYATGHMVGDIKLATLSDTDDTDVTGSELVTNGTFDSDTSGWSAVNSTLSLSSGAMRVTISTSGLAYAYQAITTVAGKTYTATMSIPASNNPGNNYGFRIGTSVGANDLGQDWTGSPDASATLTFTATGTTTYVHAALSYTAGQWAEFDNISVRLAEEDRSVNGNGLQVFGTVTKSAVATGADLMAYSGFSGSNYLMQPYNSDLDFTGDFCWNLWYYHVAVSQGEYIVFRAPFGNGTPKTEIFVNTDNTLGIYVNDLGAIYTPAAAVNTWHHLVATRKNGTIRLYFNGKEVASGASTADLTNTNAIMAIGIRTTGGYNGITGKVALLRASATAPSAEQIKKIYNDEKHLFQENAKATLYGSSDAVTALAYDDDTELLHTGTSAGRSVFQGLRRIDNTTDAVGAAISASNGMVAED